MRFTWLDFIDSNRSWIHIGDYRFFGENEQMNAPGGFPAKHNGMYKELKYEQVVICFQISIFALSETVSHYYAIWSSSL